MFTFNLFLYLLNDDNMHVYFLKIYICRDELKHIRAVFVLVVYIR